MARIVFVTGSLAHGGAERHSITLMNGLTRRGHTCHAVYVKDEGEQLGRIAEADRTERVHCLRATRYFDPAALRRFAQALADIAPTVVVAANPYALMYAALALKWSRQDAALVVTYHSNRLLGFKEHLQMLWYRAFFWMSDCAVFVCDAQRRRWRWRGVLARRNEVIHNGVDTEAFQCVEGSSAGRASRQQLGLAADDFVVGISAVLRPEKNHLQFVDAIAALRKRGLPARGLIIGDGPMRAAIEQRIAAHGLSGAVQITGLQSDVRPFIAACDVLTLCSFTEAFSLAAVEAMALGKPVVHSRVGGAPELIVPGRNGFLFPVGETAVLVDNLARLADVETARKMGRQARADVEARFSESAMLDRYERILQEIGSRALGATS